LGDVFYKTAADQAHVREGVIGGVKLIHRDQRRVPVCAVHDARAIAGDPNLRLFKGVEAVLELSR
jgi:hypothetical protein